jgi:DNA mismatch endonuclease, patch repair protein
MDNLTIGQRSRAMSRVRSRGTAAELAAEVQLRSAGYRPVKHVSNLPGRPDFVLPQLGVCVFVHGCFWHGHNCRRAALPQTNSKFWQTKIESNKRRDQKTTRVLRRTGWHVYQIWQCTLGRDCKRVIALMNKLPPLSKAKARQKPGSNARRNE